MNRASTLVALALCSCTGDVPVGHADDPLVDCDTDPEAAGCPCEAPATADCYEGAAGTVGIGECAAGVRTCDGGRWSACEGQVWPAEEICNGLDDDCDGLVDRAPGAECGLCERCETIEIGVGGIPFDATPRQCPQGPGGALQLGTGSIGHLWILEHDGVVRIDEASRTAVAAVQVAEGSREARFAAVGTAGEIYVSTTDPSAPAAVDRVLARDCRDLDDDGAVETSSAPSDRLPIGQDECVDWSLSLGGPDGQASPIGFVELPQLDGGRWPLLWAGGAAAEQVEEIDADEGELTGRIVNLPGCRPTGVEGDDLTVWVGCDDGSVFRVDAIPGVAVGKALVPDHALRTLAIDEDGRLWLGEGGGGGAWTCDFDTEDCSELAVGVNTFAADHDGTVWVGGCTELDAPWRGCGIATEDSSIDWIDVSIEGLELGSAAALWSIAGDEGGAWVIDRAALGAEPVLEDCPECFDGLVTAAPLHSAHDATQIADACGWSRVLSVCEEGEVTTWRAIRWDATTEGNGGVDLDLQATDDESGEGGTRIPVANHADGAGTLDLDAQAPFLLVEARLAGRGATGATLQQIAIDYSCR